MFAGFFVFREVSKPTYNHKFLVSDSVSNIFRTLTHQKWPKLLYFNMFNK
jgi:hypothetical protein